MSKRTAVALIVALCVLSMVAVGGVTAQTSDWTVGTSSEAVTFEPGDGRTISDTVTVTNNDVNNSVDISASIDGSHSATGPGTVGPGQSATVDVTLDSDGPESATLTIEDNSGNTETVDYTVRTPAYVEISGVPSWVDDEGVLRGESRDAQITVEEVGEYSGFNGLDVSGANGVSGLESASAGAGGTTTVEVTFTADSNARQYDDIGGTLSVDPDDGYTVESSVTLESFVAFPAQFGDVSLGRSYIEFDEPRSAGTISRTASLNIENSGDRELDFGGVSVGSTPFDVNVVSAPNTIGPTSTGTVTVELVASTDMSEGSYDFDATVQSSDASVDSADVSETIEVRHGISMNVNPTQTGVGDVPIGNADSASVTVSEELGYRNIRSPEMTLKEGPEQYIDVTSDLGSTIGSGSSTTVSYEIQFDTSANIGSEYAWTFVIDGEGVDSQEVTLTATPIPLNLDPLRQDLENAPGGSPALDQTSEKTTRLVNDMDDRIREGDVPREDITTVLTFGDGVIRYLEAIAATDELIADGDYDAAQEELVRAAVAYDTMTTYGEAIRDDDLRSQSMSISDTAGSELESRLETQETHYEERLSEGNTSPIEEATIKRQLARIAALRGDTERAQSLEAEAETAFGTYSTLVAEGETERQQAESVWQGMQSDIFVSVLGQQLILNPIHYDEFEARSTEMLSNYDDAEAAFTEAGETTRAETVAGERSQRESALTIARWSLFVSIGIGIVLVVALIAHTVRGMYWYVQDSKESISGDFLV